MSYPKPVELRLHTVESVNDEKVLRTPSLIVEDFKDPTLRPFIQGMFYVMWKNNGVGLAAPQVGVNRRIVVVDYENYLMVLINPHSYNQAPVRERYQEGCLSIPGRTGVTRRSVNFNVKYKTRSGEDAEINARAGLNCVLAHEIDHLHGILFIDILEKDTPVGTL